MSFFTLKFTTLFHVILASLPPQRGHLDSEAPPLPLYCYGRSAQTSVLKGFHPHGGRTWVFVEGVQSSTDIWLSAIYCLSIWGGTIIPSHFLTHLVVHVISTTPPSNTWLLSVSSHISSPCKMSPQNTPLQRHPSHILTPPLLPLIIILKQFWIIPIPH